MYISIIICNKQKDIKPFIINMNETAIISLNTAITHALMRIFQNKIIQIIIFFLPCMALFSNYTLSQITFIQISPYILSISLSHNKCD